MTTEDRGRVYRTRRAHAARWLAAVGFVLVFLALAFMAIGQLRVDSSAGTGTYASDESLGFLGVWQSSPEEDPQPLTRASDLDAGGASEAICTGRLGTTIPQGEPIMMYVRGVSVALYQNGEQIFAFGQPTDWSRGQAAAAEGWCVFASPGIERDDQIRLVMTKTHPEWADDSFNLLLDSLSAGSTTALSDRQLEWHRGQIGFAAVLAALAIALVVAGASLALVRRIRFDAPFLGSLALIACAANLASDPRFASLATDDIGLVNLIGIMSLLAAIECLGAWMSVYVRGRRARIAVYVWLGVVTAGVLASVVALAIGIAPWTQVASALVVPTCVLLPAGAAILLADALANRTVGSLAEVAAAILAPVAGICLVLAFGQMSRPWSLVSACGTALALLAASEIASEAYLSWRVERLEAKACRPKDAMTAGRWSRARHNT